MLLTRSIRRKLAVSLALLLGMLAVLALAGLSGLSSYRTLVRNLEVAVREAPRQSDLLAAIGRLSEPLGSRMPRTADPAFEAAARRQRAVFQETVGEVREEVEAYYQRLRKFRGTPATGDRLRDPFGTKRRILEELDRMQREATGLSKPQVRDASVVAIAGWQSRLYHIAEDAPDPLNEVLPMLRAARNSYQVRFWFVSVATAAALLLLAVQIALGYGWVYVPVRKLHAGARAVAAGEYDTRIDLNTGDEMADLAVAFNRMTERFEAALSDRDREIAERSKQLVQSARLADVGFLSAGIAHEVNNPLAAVGMAAEGLEWRLEEVLAYAEAGGMAAEEAVPVREYLEMIQKEAGRVRELTQKMLDFARRDPAEGEEDRHRYDITAIVREVISMLNHMKRYAAHEIRFEGNEPMHARVSAGQIKQVVLNVTANALDALGEAHPEGGRLEIRAAESPDNVELTFKDNGTGMTAATIDHLFDPFFTTKTGQKKDGTTGGVKGTGLGLAISHRIATDHGGVLEAESPGEGQGSTFRLRLPKALEAKRAA